MRRTGTGGGAKSKREAVGRTKIVKWRRKEEEKESEKKVEQRGK